MTIGITALLIFSRDKPEIVLATYRLIATGGVTIPIDNPSTITTPKCIRSIPSC